MCIRDRDYTELEEKAVAATAHHNELSAQIKATEKRMAEIAVLRTHIVNYATMMFTAEPMVPNCAFLATFWPFSTQIDPMLA